MKTCDICGGKVHHFENPSRDICENESSHARLKKNASKGDKRTGEDRPRRKHRNQHTKNKDE